MRIRRRFAIQTEIPQVSLADVAFLLLIFFISTTSMELDRFIGLALPGQSSAKVTVFPRQVLTLRGDRSGVLYADGRPVERGALRELIRSRVEKDSSTVVSISADPDAPYQVMVTLLDEVQRSGAGRVALHSAGGE
ncbi:MAG: biopolymer transporter ExbD [Candidatus Eisenbacteria bacterium]|nr:biopolymer transporter ExbD [Candidatus Eisenbacteria bacterium]MCC7141813.1 biopolymer transporter ExbD [Candidatus Eisenbacteria bacterium]